MGENHEAGNPDRRLAPAIAKAAKAAALTDPASILALVERVKKLEAWRKEIECRGNGSSSGSLSASQPEPSSSQNPACCGAEPWALGYFFSRVSEGNEQPLSETLREFARRVIGRFQTSVETWDDDVTAELRAAIGGEKP